MQRARELGDNGRQMRAARTLSVCCLTGGAAPGRLAAVLGLLRPVADEIVVAVEARNYLECVTALSGVADRLVSFPLEEAGDRPIAWLFAQCEADWIFNIDDDEVPGADLIALLPELVADDDVTHHWISRRWLFQESGSYLDEPPWFPEYQLRLVRDDPRFLHFSDEFHRPVIALGPARFIDAPLWHLQFLVQSYRRRWAKALAYERARRGMRLAGVSHNSGLYLPELRVAPRLGSVPGVDVPLIDAALAAAAALSATARVQTRAASVEDIERHWPGGPFPESLYRARLELRQELRLIRTGGHQTVDVLVENGSDSVWRWGKEAQPEIRLAYRWHREDGPHVEPEGLRTPFPADLAPGRRQLVPVDVVAPAAPGRYRLEIDLVHEYERWFGCSVNCDVLVLPARRIAIAGDPMRVDEILDVLVLLPELEPLLLQAQLDLPPQRFGHPRIPGLRSYLFHGLSGAPKVRLLAALLARTIRLRAAARSYARGRRGRRLGEGADDFVEQLAGCELLVLAGDDSPPAAPRTRELWRIAATEIAARALGVPVVRIDGDAFAARGPIDRTLLALVRRRSPSVDSAGLAERLDLPATVRALGLEP
jgi:hypothetical protein